jgi:NAD(P)-dependent dehydrogenase (short-subunit alcohol dehydrogenase family)/acyl carrier protein
LSGTTALTGNGLSVRRVHLSPETHWPLHEHRLLGMALVPGTFYLDMAAAATEAHWGGTAAVLADVEFLEPLVLADDESRVVHLTLREIGAGEAVFDVASAPDEHTAPYLWTTHVRGRALRTAAVSAAAVGAEELTHVDGGELIDTAALQSEHESMTFGPRWVRAMSSVMAGAEEAVARIGLPEEVEGDVHDFVLHPAVLDLATGFGALLGSEAAGSAAERALNLPVGYESLQIHRPVPAQVISRMRRSLGGSASQVRRFDVDVYDPAGEPVLTIRGFTTRRVGDAEATLSRSRSRLRHHELVWTPVQDGPAPDAEVAEQRVLLVVPSEAPNGLGDLRSAFEAAGHEVLVGEMTTMAAAPSGGTDLRDGVALADYVAVSDHVVIVLPPVGGSGGGTADVLGAEVATEHVFSAARLLSAARSLPRRLSVVALEAESDVAHVHSQHAAAFAVAQAFALENGLALVCVAGQGRGLDHLVRRLGGERVPGTVLLRSDGEYVQELHRAPASALGPATEHRTFLITGGLGGLGLAIALHLARTRPRVRIALLSRRELPPRSEWERLAEAESPQCRFADLLEIERLADDVRVVHGDVSDLEVMTRVVDDLAAAWSGIDCVVHAAGIAGEGFLALKGLDEFRRTLAPKVRGTTVLDRVLGDAAVKLLVLFSSTVTVFGAPGQGDYAAGNRFMEAFAAERTARGRRTVAIGWSDWLERGMAVDYDVTPDSGFFRSLPLSDALDSFELLLRDRDGHTTYVGEVNSGRLDGMSSHEWDSFLAASPVRLGKEILAAVARRRDDIGDRSTGQGETTTATVSLTGREVGGFTPMEQQVADLWAAELGLAEIDVTASTFDLGGDSLTALRIASSIEKNVGVRISMLELFQFETVEALAAELCRISEQHDEGK